MVQLFIISTYWSQDAFSLMLNLTSVMALIPFLLVAGYAFLLVRSGQTYEGEARDRSRDMVIATIALAYTIFLIFAAGLEYLVLSAILYGPGTVLFLWARREQGKSWFPRGIDLALFALAMLGCALGIWWLATGYITL